MRCGAARRYPASAELNKHKIRCRKIVPIITVKREVGAIPTRSRRCEVESAQRCHWVKPLKRGIREGCADIETEPEELPDFVPVDSTEDRGGAVMEDSP